MKRRVLCEGVKEETRNRWKRRRIWWQIRLKLLIWLKNMKKGKEEGEVAEHEGDIDKTVET